MNTNNANCAPVGNNSVQNPWFQSLPAFCGCGYLSGNPPLQYRSTNVIGPQQGNSFVECVCVSGNGQVMAIAYSSSMNVLSYIDIYVRNNNAGQNKQGNWQKTQSINFNSGFQAANNANGFIIVNPNGPNDPEQISVNVINACDVNPATVNPVGPNLNNSNNPAVANISVTCGDGVVCCMAMEYCGTTLCVGAPTLGVGGCCFIFTATNMLCFALSQQLENQTPNTTMSMGQSVAISADGTTVAIGATTCAPPTNNSINCVAQGSVLIMKMVNCNCWLLVQEINPTNANILQNIGCDPLFPGNTANGNFLQNPIGNLLGTNNPGQATNLNTPLSFLGIGPNKNAIVGNCCGANDALFGQSVALSAINGNHLVIGGNNVAYVFSCTNNVQCNPCETSSFTSCLPTSTVLNFNNLPVCNSGMGPYSISATLVGSAPGNTNPNQYNQGIACAISADGKVVAVGSNLGANACPIVPATVWIFEQNANAFNNGTGNCMNIFQQRARLVGSKGRQRFGACAAQMGLFLSVDGRYVIFGDPNWSCRGTAADGAVWAFMRTVTGAVEQTRLESPQPNAEFGTTLGVPQAIDSLSVTAPTIPNMNGSGATYVFT